LLTKVVSSFWKRLTVVRVMSDVTASTSYQAAPPKPARFDPTQGFDSFGSLVDSNLPPSPPPSAPAQAAPQRSSDRTADRSSPRDAAPDQSAPNDRTDPGGQAGLSDPSAAAASNPADSKADKASRGDGKAGDATSGDGKTAETKSSDKSAKDSASGDASATDAAAVAQPNLLVLTTQDPVATAIPVTIAPTGAPTASRRRQPPHPPAPLPRRRRRRSIRMPVLASLRSPAARSRLKLRPSPLP
jgi:hypothetical protein